MHILWSMADKLLLNNIAKHIRISTQLKYLLYLLNELCVINRNNTRNSNKYTWFTNYVQHVSTYYIILVFNINEIMIAYIICFYKYVCIHILLRKLHFNKVIFMRSVRCYLIYMIPAICSHRLFCTQYIYSWY